MSGPERNEHEYMLNQHERGMMDGRWMVEEESWKRRDKIDRDRPRRCRPLRHIAMPLLPCCMQLVAWVCWSPVEISRVVISALLRSFILLLYYHYFSAGTFHPRRRAPILGLSYASLRRCVGVPLGMTQLFLIDVPRQGSVMSQTISSDFNCQLPTAL